MDVFSRKIVGHRVETSEKSVHAQTMIDQAVATNQQCPTVLHADNGAPMRAATTVQFAQSLGIKLSFSRPRVSNDNAFSESTFKTIKYHLDFPIRFESIDHARDYMAAFIADYNANHRHSGLNYYTPDDVHHGRTELVRARRQATLDARHCAHPERFHTSPIAAGPPTHAGINSPENTELSQTACNILRGQWSRRSTVVAADPVAAAASCCPGGPGCSRPLLPRLLSLLSALVLWSPDRGDSGQTAISPRLRDLKLRRPARPQRTRPGSHHRDNDGGPRQRCVHSGLGAASWFRRKRSRSRARRTHSAAGDRHHHTTR